MLRWIAAQPWCDGAIGMIGTSWGGFNGLQIAAHAPPELKAVASYFASDDRYGDDVHYRGGCVLGMDMLHWSVSMLSFLAQPPLPWVVGDGWREQWLERLETMPAARRDLARAPAPRRLLAARLGARRLRRHPVRRDGDRRLDRRLHRRGAAPAGGPRRPRRGVIGPWGHNDTEAGVPGPGAGVLREVVRWYDRWLKGIDNGADEAPMLAAYLQDRIVPAGALRACGRGAG